MAMHGRARRSAWQCMAGQSACQGAGQGDGMVGTTCLGRLLLSCNVWLWVCLRLCICICRCICIRMCISIYICIWMYRDICTYISMCIYVCIYIYIYIYIGAMLPRPVWAACHCGLFGRPVRDGMIGATCLGRLAWGRPTMSFLVAECTGRGAGRRAGRTAGRVGRTAGRRAGRRVGHKAGRSAWQCMAGQGAAHGNAWQGRAHGRAQGRGTEWLGQPAWGGCCYHVIYRCGFYAFMYMYV